MPLPAHLGSQQQEKRGAEEFLERKRQQAMEDVLKRDEWMLVPPSKSDRLRQNDNGEWRLADEPSREKRWKENSEVPDDYGRSALEARKWQRTKGEIQRAVSEYNRKIRPDSLLRMHAKNQETSQPKSKKEEPI